MKKLVPIVIVALVAWFAYGKYEAQRQRNELSQASAETEMEAEDEDEAIEHSENPFPERSEVQFTCDGRTHCSEMTSCKEAKYFINHCPGTKMDGDEDGVPCEDQWCNHLR